ncbi:MAG: MoxR family ATPase [Chitinophagaceae bacterium]
MENTIQLDTLNQAVEQIKSNIGKVIVGQEKMVELLITALLAQGHVLIEGVPGVAKTLTAKLLARSIDVPFSRIQFTPDLMPTDIIGTSVFLPQEGSFKFKHGPIFAQVVLIDEINRSPAKTQAALFEVMEERQISYDGTTYPMQNPFFVLATQNPIEQEGTYRLPEAQLDRFLFKISVGYPKLEEEVFILQKAQSGITTDLSAVQPVLDATQVIAAQNIVRQIHIEENVLQYIAALVYETRNNKSLYLGASPRASVAVLNSSKAIASIRGRDFVTPDDIVYVLPSVLGHRIILTPEKEMEGGTPSQIIKEIVNKVEVPR